MRCHQGGARASERVKHHVADIAVALDQRAQDFQRLLRGVQAIACVFAPYSRSEAKSHKSGSY
jgi:hypothetical protein